MNDEMQDFMRTGVFSAWDAYSALRAFEGGFAAITEEILRKERDWGPYVPQLLAVRGRRARNAFFFRAMRCVVRSRREKDENV